MDRPKVTKEMIVEAAQKIAATVDCDAGTIASCYTHPMDGYQLAKAIDRKTYGDLTISAARYLVQENGCTNENRSLLVKFEDAVEVTPEIKPSAPKPTICHKHG